MSSTCSSMVGAVLPGTGSDRPTPRLSYKTSRLNDASRRMNRASDGSIQLQSTCEFGPDWTTSRFGGPLPSSWYARWIAPLRA